MWGAWALLVLLPSSVASFCTHYCFSCPRIEIALSAAPKPQQNAGQQVKRRRRRNVNDIDVDSVSDAEALLACRSYLQRRNKLGLWKSKERRRLAQPPSLKNSTAVSDSDTGFFWPDPTQLKYLYRSDEEIIDDDGDQEDVWKDDEEDNYRIPKSSDGEVSAVPDRISIDQIENDVRFDDNTLENDEDYQTHRRRSLAARKSWSDPQFRARWYEKRWGSKRRAENKRSVQEKILEGRLRAIDPDEFLASPSLAEMTEDEIRSAILTYVTANRKRSVSRQTSLEARKSALRPHPSRKGGRLPREFLLNKNPIQMESERRRRSEMAAKRYQSRMANLEKANKLKSKKPASVVLPHNIFHQSPETPTGALLKIKEGLQTSEIPSLLDLELVLEPTRLANRKQVLLKVLSECFGLRGKCVPAGDVLDQWLLLQSEGNYDSIHDDDPEIDYAFTTQSSVRQIGKLIEYNTKKVLLGY